MLVHDPLDVRTIRIDRLAQVLTRTERLALPCQVDGTHSLVGRTFIQRRLARFGHFLVEAIEDIRTVKADFRHTPDDLEFDRF